MDKVVRILVLGTAGSGKTTLLERISYPWKIISSSSKTNSSSTTSGLSSSSSSSSTNSSSTDILSNNSINHTIGSNVEIILHSYDKPSTPDENTNNSYINNNTPYQSQNPLLRNSTITTTSSSTNSLMSSLVTIQLIEVSDDIDYQEAVKVYYDSIDGIILLLDASLSMDIQNSVYLLDDYCNYLYTKEILMRSSHHHQNTHNNTPPHRTIARRLQMIPILVIANKTDKINRLNTMMQSIMYNSSSSSSPSIINSIINLLPLQYRNIVINNISPLLIPRPPGTVTNTKIITRLDTSLASSSLNTNNTTLSILSSLSTILCCRPSTRYFPISLTPTMIWTNLNNSSAPFPRDIIDHYFNEIIYMKYDYYPSHPEDQINN